ncbi:hypothetical protein TNCV_3997311 [Trichonephila clavipes]|nr:hypothetical protein TNCV_3997311 [Trichonephila clavipes]
MAQHALPAIARDWLLRHHPIPHASMGLGVRVDVMSNNNEGFESEQIKVGSDSFIHVCSLLVALNTPTLQDLAVVHSC